MKAKPILLVVLTLVIGFVIGMLTSAQIRFNRLKPVRVYFSEDRFREGFFKIIQPDEKQKAVIDEIIKKYARINSELQGKFRKETDSNMKELRKELDSKLTKDQLARLKEMDERREKMIKEGRKHRNDSTGRSGMRPENRGDRPYFDERHVPPGERSFPRDGRPPFSPPDSTGSPDDKQQVIK
jgi:hypothetical protein